MHRGFDRAQHLGITGQRGARHDDVVAPGRVQVRRVRRETGHRHAGLEVFHALAHGFDDAGEFITDARRQLGLIRGEVLPPEHVAPTDAQCLGTDQHFTRPRLRGRHFLDLQDRGVTELVETDHAGHHIPRLNSAHSHGLYPGFRGDATVHR